MHSPQYPNAQRGAIGLQHVLILIIVVVGMVLLYKKNMLPDVDSIPGVTSIKNQLPTLQFNAQPNNQSVNASVAAAEGELINDEWTPPSEDNEVYQDKNDNSISLMTPEPVPASRTVTREVNVAPTKSRPRPQPAKVNNPPKTFPANLAQGYYTVQVYAGYNSKAAYSIKRSLEQDGYLVYIYQLEDKAGQLFRVRVGRYANLNSAKATRDQIRRRYPKHLNRSFVLMRQPSS